MFKWVFFSSDNDFGIYLIQDKLVFQWCLSYQRVISRTLKKCYWNSFDVDVTLEKLEENVDVVLETLQEVGKVLFEWFSNNFLKANADKCHLILRTDEPFSINKPFPFSNNEVIKNSNYKKLLGISLNKRLGFDNHVRNICNLVSNKLHALAGISQFMNIHKRRMTRKTFIVSEFGYCSLV